MLSTNHLLGCYAGYGVEPCECRRIAQEQAALLAPQPSGADAYAFSKLSSQQLGQLAEQLGRELAKRFPEYRAVGEFIERTGRSVAQFGDGRDQPERSDRRRGRRSESARRAGWCSNCLNWIGNCRCGG